VATCIKNIPIFDPDTVYLYSDPLIEIDYLMKCSDNAAGDPCILNSLCQLLGKSPDNKSDYLIIEAEDKMDRIIDKHIRRSSLSATYIPNTIFLNESNKREIRCIDACCNCQEPQERDRLYWLYGELMNTLFLGTALLPQPLLNSWTENTDKDKNKGMGNVKSPLYTISKIHGSKNLPSDPLKGVIELTKPEWKTSTYNKWLEKKYKEILSLCPTNQRERKITVVVPVQSGLGAYRLAKIYSTIKTITEWLRRVCNSIKDGLGEKIEVNAVFVLSRAAYDSLRRDINALIGKDREIQLKIRNDESAVDFIKKYMFKVIVNADLTQNPWKPNSPWEEDSMHTSVEVFNTFNVDFTRYLKHKCIIFLIAGDFAKKPIEQIIRHAINWKERCIKILVVNESYYITSKGNYTVTTRDSYFYAILGNIEGKTGIKGILEENSEFLNNIPDPVDILLDESNKEKKENVKSKLMKCSNYNEEEIYDCETRLGIALLLFKSIIIDLSQKGGLK